MNPRILFSWVDMGFVYRGRNLLNSYVMKILHPRLGIKEHVTDIPRVLFFAILSVDG